MILIINSVNYIIETVDFQVKIKGTVS